MVAVVESFLRRACAPYHFRVDPADVARFARCLGATERPVPLMFAVRALPPAVRQVLAGLRPAPRPDRIRHASQAFCAVRPPAAGEELLAVPSVLAIGKYGFQQAVVIGLSLRDSVGAEVLDMTTTLTIGPATGGRRLAMSPVPPGGAVVLRWSERVPQGLASAYASASGDDNPIHLDENAARAAGLPGVILQGMATFHLALAGVIRRVHSGDQTRVRAARARFARPVRPGEAIDFVVRAAASRRGGLRVGASVDGAAVLKDACFEDVSMG